MEHPQDEQGSTEQAPATEPSQVEEPQDAGDGTEVEVEDDEFEDDDFEDDDFFDDDFED